MKDSLVLLAFALIAACASCGPCPTGSRGNGCITNECSGSTRTPVSYALPCTEDRGFDACGGADSPEARRAAKEEADLVCRTPERSCTCEKRGVFEEYHLELDLTFQTPPHRGVPPFCIAVCKVRYEGACKEAI